MNAIPLTYQGVEFTLVREARGWAARIPRFGQTMYFASQDDAIDDRLTKIREARVKGYEGDSCGECGNFTLVRNGTCMKCNTCGGTSGCS